MLSGTIDSGKGLLVKQAGQTMVACDALEGLHHHLIVVNCDVHLSINRSQLMLGRGRLVVLTLGRMLPK